MGSCGYSVRAVEMPYFSSSSFSFFFSSLSFPLFFLIHKRRSNAVIIDEANGRTNEPERRKKRKRERANECSCHGFEERSGGYYWIGR